jgi:hypothetical protein
MSLQEVSKKWSQRVIAIFPEVVQLYKLIEDNPNEWPRTPQPLPRSLEFAVYAVSVRL